MIAAEHGLRQLREERRQDEQGQRSPAPPVVRDATGVRAPADSLSELADRLVETGIPWNTPGADVRHPLGHRLLVHVDAVAVPGGEGPGVAGRLREPDQQQRHRRDDDLRRGAPTRCRGSAAAAPAARGARRRPAPPRARRGRTGRGEEAADHQDQRAGDRGRREPQAEDHGERHARRPASVVQLMSPSAPIHERELPPGVVALGRGAGQLGQLADDDVDRGPGEEAR